MGRWPSPERLVVAGTVRTFHSGSARALPRALVVGAGRVLAAVDPDDRAVRRELDGLAHTDFGDSVLVPGFIDAHNHQPTAARDVDQIRTAQAGSLPELLAIISAAAAAARAGSWLATEHSLTMTQLRMDRLPNAAELDHAAPEHCVAVRFGAHVMALNSRALIQAGLDTDVDPPGGILDRNAEGRPTGPIREYGATSAVLARLTPPDPAGAVDRMRRVQRRYAEAGVTSVRVPGLRPGEWGTYQRLRHIDGSLLTRVFGGPRLDPTSSREGKLETLGRWEPRTGAGDEWLRLNAVKIFVDGGLETAVHGTEHLFVDDEELHDLVAAAASAGWSVACHAVCARAVDAALDAFAAAERFRSPHCRFSVEHGFFAGADQLRRAAELGVWLSIQPAIAAIDGELVAAGLGAHRLSSSWPLGEALRLGVQCALGSDWNATPGTDGCPFDPLISIATSVERRSLRGLDLSPAAPPGHDVERTVDQAVDVDTACYLHTRAPAELVGADDLGGIWPGARADLVALSGDPRGDPREVTVRATIVGGVPISVSG